jgi:GAF domain-containing protein
MRLVHTCGDWKEEAKLTVAMQSDDAKIGVIALGARKGGEEYTAQDRDVLQQTADWVVRAISLAKRDN